MNYFWFKKNLQTAITMPRVHDQLYPNFVFAETKFPTEIVNGLKALGHKVGLIVKTNMEKTAHDLINNALCLNKLNHNRKGGLDI